MLLGELGKGVGECFGVVYYYVLEIEKEVVIVGVECF